MVLKNKILLLSLWLWGAHLVFSQADAAPPIDRTPKRVTGFLIFKDKKAQIILNPISRSVRHVYIENSKRIEAQLRTDNFLGAVDAVLIPMQEKKSGALVAELESVQLSTHERGKRLPNYDNKLNLITTAEPTSSDKGL